jgi:hypothetical protein
LKLSFNRIKNGWINSNFFFRFNASWRKLLKVLFSDVIKLKVVKKIYLIFSKIVEMFRMILITFVRFQLLNTYLLRLEGEYLKVHNIL